MDKNTIIKNFQDCITVWNRKLSAMDSITGQGSLFNMNPNVNDINYYIGSLDSIGEKYIKELIEYGNAVIQQLQTITFPPFPSRDEQNEYMRNMNNIVNEIPFPVHENKRLKGVGREMVFLGFPLKSNVVTTGSYPASPYQNWSTNIPDLVIERINCYLDAFKSLIRYTPEQPIISEQSIISEQTNIQPVNIPVYKKTVTASRGGKRKRKTHKKRSNKIKSKSKSKGRSKAKK